MMRVCGQEVRSVVLDLPLRWNTRLMNADATPPAKPDGADGRRLTDAEIEAQVRAAYGPKLEACARLHAFGEDALYTWAGRPIDPESVDPIILAEGARATKTYGGTVRLAAGGFGPQASH
jgi:hypothetical protein